MCNLFILDPVWVSALAAFVAAFAAILYVIFTRKVVKEMQKDREEVKENRKLEYKPIIKAIYMTGKPPDTLLYNFKNVGKGPALNFEIRCGDKGEIEWRSKKILAIGSSEEISATFDIKFKNNELRSEIFLDIEYTDIFGTVYKERELVSSKSDIP